MEATTTPSEDETKAVSYDPTGALDEFHKAMEVKPFIEEDAYGRQKLLDLRMRLVSEEFTEFIDEILDIRNGQGSMARLAKEGIDLLYVVYGTLRLLEIPVAPVFNEVHRSNMSKLGTDGKPVRDAGGKVLKGPNYSPADIESVLTSGVSD